MLRLRAIFPVIYRYMRKRQKIRYHDILPNKNDWPIVRLSKNRSAFVEEVTNIIYEEYLQKKGSAIRDDIEATIHREKIRIKSNPWKVDPPNEKAYWNKVQKQLITASPEDEKQLLKEIIFRYSDEITGNFKMSAYKFARSFLTFGFARLLNAVRVKGFLALFSRQLDLDDKLHVIGEVEHIRKLSKIGTVIMVPTHFSNLDSILIGWCIQHIGLPPYIYGAGLNLFNIKILAYFMSSLGAYKLDRRKKNPIYLETLKTFSRTALDKGCHTLFFPGGTRSRSGQIESRLKLGLLGSVVEAQRLAYQRNDEASRKIFVVPVVINYHFTLEAPSLIKQHLSLKGQERYYVEHDSYSTSYRIATFLLKFFTKGSDVSVSIGKGLDVLGNYVDFEGNSLDKKGNVIDTREYFITDNEITHNEQRETQYTKVLGERIVEEYYLNNRVFASHLVAYTAFKMLQRKNEKLDLYEVLRLHEEDLILDYDEFKLNFKKLRKELDLLHQQGKVDMADHMKDKASDAIDLGLKNVGLYHDKRPLVLKKDKIVINNPNVLYYYHNRMKGYGLEKYI